MNCIDCEQLLQQQLDGAAITDRAALDAHLTSCAPCRARYAAAQSLLESLRLLALPPPPEGLSATIVASVLEQQRAARRFRRRVVATAAIAASFLLLAFTLSSWLRGSLFGPGQTNILVVHDDNSGSMRPTDEVPPDLPPPSPSLNDAVAEARTAVVALTRRTADETVGQTRLLLPESVPTLPIPGAEPMSPALEVPAEPLRDATQGVASGLEPVTTSARRAVDLFLRGISPLEPERKPAL